MEAVLLAFRPAMLEACGRQFPKTCGKCKKTYASFKSYVEETVVLGKPRPDPEPSDDPIGLMCFANCGCKSTLALVYEPLPQHEDFNAALDAVTQLTGRSPEDVAAELVQLLHAHALADNKKHRSRKSVVPTDDGPDPMLLEIGAAIVEMVSQGKLKIPPYSLVADRVQQLARKKELGMHEITKLVTVDQALASMVLRTANSAEWRRTSEVTSLPVAVTRIGANEIARLAFATSFGGYALKSGPLGAVRQRLWHRSVTTAVLSRYLGKQRGLPPESCFAAGLLHDIGSLLAAVNLEAFFNQRTMTAKPLEFWLRVIEHFHVEIGVLAAQAWALPSNVRDCIAFHHMVSREGCSNPDMVDVVTAADGVAYLLAEKPQVTEQDLELVPYLQSAAERAVLAKALPEIPQLIAAFESPDEASTSSKLLSKRSKPTKRKARDGNNTTIVNAQKPLQKYALVEASHAGLSMRGIFELPESFLVELRIEAATPFKLWARIETCLGDGNEYLVTVSPFALDRQRQAKWTAFVEAQAEADEGSVIPRGPGLSRRQH